MTIQRPEKHIVIDRAPRLYDKLFFSFRNIFVSAKHIVRVHSFLFTYDALNIQVVAIIACSYQRLSMVSISGMTYCRHKHAR